MWLVRTLNMILCVVEVVVSIERTVRLAVGVPFVPPAIVAADYTPLLAAGEAQLPAAALALLRVDVEKQRNKEVLRLKQTMPKFNATLWESLSIESREEVSQHTDFEQADLNQDQMALVSELLS
jgi:hypothetical protein